MSRYQCPLCQTFHPNEAKPKCPIHGLGYSPRCTSCVQAAANPPCRGQS